MDNTNRTDFENNSKKTSIPCEIGLKFAGIYIVRKKWISFDISCTLIETHKTVITYLLMHAVAF